jgi:1,2-diacylglycerol 3-beta-glucosyltransferase
VLVVGSVLTVALLLYTFGLFVASRRHRGLPPPAPELFFVFLMPCLDEELVIEASLRRLLALPGSNFAVLVIDDGSEDRTAELARRFDRERVWLLQRRAPECRQGKGKALNAGYRYLQHSGLLEGRAADDVVVVVVDADGRIEPNALVEVAPYFHAPEVGAVQIGVRMYNAAEGLLARLQDVEFVTFTEIFQLARTRLGTAGMGGNGQFNRLSALQSLGHEPWSDCLTEDLELGLRLLVGGWQTAFCSTTWVSQQAVTSPRRLVRQRSRWFQGHLQCWKQLRSLLTSSMPMQAVADLVHHLLAPALLLALSVAGAIFVGSAARMLVVAPATLATWLVGAHGSRLLVGYGLAFGLTWPFGYVYWLRERRLGLARSVGLAHLYALYSYLWVPAGWLAVSRIVRRQGGWLKTGRTSEAASVAAADA